MSNPNQKKVQATLRVLLAGKLSADDATDILTRLIGRAYYNGLNVSQKTNARPQSKTRVSSDSVA